MQGYLILENGTIFAGQIIGKGPPAVGEAVFNTSMNGYQEMITDPSYAGQILVLTYPQIGNYGFGEYGFESEKPALQGLVVKEIAEVNGHYESKWGFNEFAERQNITCLTGVDTRALTRALRIHGTMGAVITGSLDDMAELHREAVRGRQLMGTDLPRQVCVREPQVLGEGDVTVVVWDFGSKRSIVKELLHRHCRVIVVPADASAQQVSSYRPDGIVLTNGPGDPRSCMYAVREIAKVVKHFPILGICLGHQLAALAMGAVTFKLPFGHRGGNHTVKELSTGQCYITSQNHGYAVDAGSLAGSGLKVSFINLNDGTVEGLEHQELPLITVQFHPEASPGPQDTDFLFDRFLNLLPHRCHTKKPAI